MAVVLEGRVKVVRLTDSGAATLLAVRGPGELLGELSALDGRPRSATVTALESGRLLIIAAERFRQWLSGHPVPTVQLLTVLAGRLREADRARAVFATTDVGSRLAQRLLELAATYGVPEGDTLRIDLPVTQHELAGWVGGSREAVAKAMHRMRARGVVGTGRRSVTVLDVDSLRRLAR